MKLVLNSWTSGLSVVFSITALVYCVSLHLDFRVNLRRTVDREIQRREERIVKDLAPHFATFFKDLGQDGYIEDPKSFEELLRPLVHIIEAVGK